MRRWNKTGRDELEETLRAHGLEPAGPAIGNFLFADVGDGAALFDRLLPPWALIVRPLGGFGAPEGDSASPSGPRRRNAFFGVCLGQVLSGVS